LTHSASNLFKHHDWGGKKKKKKSRPYLAVCSSSTLICLCVTPSPHGWHHSLCTCNGSNCGLCISLLRIIIPFSLLLRFLPQYTTLVGWTLASRLNGKVNLMLLVWRAVDLQRPLLDAVHGGGGVEDVSSPQARTGSYIRSSKWAFLARPEKGNLLR
jgi:hypothetical protein